MAKDELTADELLAMCMAAIESRAARNGYTEAMHLLTITLPKAFVKQGGPSMDEARTKILDDIYGPMLAEEEFSEASFDDATQQALNDGFMVNLTEKVVAYCVFAVRAFFLGNEGLSWSYVADAQYWAGVVMVTQKRAKLPPPGQALASLRHLETKRKRKAVEDYWRGNIDPTLSAQKAADKVVAAEVSTLSHKVIAEIISALRKAEALRKD